MALKWTGLGGATKAKSRVAPVSQTNPPPLTGQSRRHAVKPLPVIGAMSVVRQYTVLGTLLLLLVAIAGIFVVLD